MQRQTNNLPINHMIYQSIRLAKLKHLIGHKNIFKLQCFTYSDCNLRMLFCSQNQCFFVNITHNQSTNMDNDIILQCVFCNVTISVSDIFSSLPLSFHTNYTMELIEKLSSKHKFQCKGLNGAEHFKDDEVQIGVSEGFLKIDTVNGSATSM